MAAQCYFSHKSLHGLDGKQKQEKLFQEKGINWDEYPARFKHGSFIKRVKVSTPFSKQELEELPPKHDAQRINSFLPWLNGMEKINGTRKYHPSS
jgi:tRNA(His) 5'-end guanylyltransferase